MHGPLLTAYAAMPEPRLVAALGDCALGCNVLGREEDIVGALEDVFADPRFASTRAVIVRDHGAYIWGDDVMDAKRHTEVYHFLFEATVARRGRQ